MSTTDTTCEAAAGAAALSSSVTTWVWQALLYVLALPTLVYVVTYLLPQIYMCLRPVPNLKKRYGAEWALVTGGGSGIGRALAFTLAGQGLNVIVVSLDDDLLRQTMKDLQSAFPELQFRSVGVSFSPTVDYMKAIRKATADIDVVPIIFNNAGFMVTGFFDQAPVEKLLANMECNATACVKISHYFLQKMVSQKRRGCVVFTSSVAGFIPTPFAVMYASTKAFVSQFAASLHIENKPLGIDVCAIHPSPVKSQFYSNLDHKVDLIQAAAANAVRPEDITSDILRSVGVCAYRDLGALAWSTRLGTFFLPYNLFAELFAAAAPYMPDWKTHNQHRK